MSSKSLTCGSVFTDVRCKVQTCEPSIVYGTQKSKLIGESSLVKCTHGLISSRSKVECGKNGWKGPHACLKKREPVIKKSYSMCMRGKRYVEIVVLDAGFPPVCIFFYFFYFFHFFYFFLFCVFL